MVQVADVLPVQKERPVGSVPLVFVQLNGEAPPETAVVPEYAEQLVTLGKLEIPFARAAQVVIEYACCTVLPSPQLSESLIVKLYVPDALGMPIMAPVDEFRLNPGGREPEVMV
ncbi:MAG: hypothetical protein WCP33_03545 [Deltaproteobacteria bacterium]